LRVVERRPAQAGRRDFADEAELCKEGEAEQLVP
jgi:hypothetical protein